MKRFSQTLMAAAALLSGFATMAQEKEKPAEASSPTAAATTTNAAPARNIRLQFEGIP